MMADELTQLTIHPGLLSTRPGWDSGAGGRFAERLLTVVTSCRQQGRPLLNPGGSG
jgi:hypothetical protein